MTTSINPHPATRMPRKGRILLWGKSGSGKTLTSLKLARGLAGPVGTICVIDTDYEASTLYADEYRFDIQPLDPPFDPDRFTEVLRQLSPHYDVVVLDTGTHEWTGEGGCLEIRDREAIRLKDNSWAAWAKVTPAHQRFLKTLMRCPAHLIVTLRAKTVTEQVKNEKTGKTDVVDLGLFPQQRSDGEEFAYGLDISGRLDPEDQGARLTITNTRYQAWHGAVFANPDEALGVELAAWLRKGVAPTAVGLPDHPPATTPPAATEDQAPPPEPSAARLEAQDHPRLAEAMMTRGQLLNTISTELFRQVRARGDAGRRQRAALLEACFGQPTVSEVTTLADDVLEAGLHHLLATGEGRRTTTQGRREREPGEEG
jgi:AAA domain